jgi:hypothetical protein
MRAIAAVGVGALGCVLACDFTDSWEKYCRQSGQCAFLDGGSARLQDAPVDQVRQGTGQVRVTLRGGFLMYVDAGIQLDPPLSYSVVSWSEDTVELSVEVPHGAQEGPVTFTLSHQPPAELPKAASPLRITPIVVSKDGGTVGGAGTFRSPLCCLPLAVDIAESGDTILLAEGRYEAEDWSPATPGSTSSITLPPGVNLRGEGPGKTVLANPPLDGLAAVNISTPGHTISNLKTSGFYRAVVVEFAVDGGVLLKDVEIEDAKEAGLWVGGQASVRMESVVIRGTGAAGVGGGRGGIVVSGNSELHLQDSQILSNRQAWGVHVEGTGQPRVMMRRTSILDNDGGLYVGANAGLNGGTGMSPGDNVLDNSRAQPEILDDRPADSGGDRIEFSTTDLRGQRPAPGVYNSGDVGLGIQVTRPGNGVRFH